MCWYHWIAIISLTLSFSLLTFQFVRLLFLGRPNELSAPSGNVSKGVIYSFTKAMSPSQKESAYMHLPTYAAGIIYHIGTFLSLGIFLVFISGITEWYEGIKYFLSALLFVSVAAGFAVLIKRVLNSELKSLSGPDDYISNLLTTFAQLFSAFFLLFPGLEPFYYLTMSLFLVWLPLGKTRHLLYFFFARYHLGFFYGWRGTWPQKTE
ncbi:MAG: hypothetical protein ACD_77C00477G0010 [uncultured bacterium]|nr:MAG: hypothetical protein ACD_77C00477G0010 [uncultured bacterium]HBY02683.1 hypothetical protein [Rikenellaceae bacterium]